MAYIGIDPNVGDISFQQFTGDGSTTAFTLAQSVASGEAIIVTIGNVVQEPGGSAAYTAYANTLTFSAAPANGDVITVRYFGRAVDQPLSYGMQLFKYVATASQTVFTGADSNGAILAFSGTDVDVYLNGVHLDADDFTPSSGNTITLATGASLNDDLVVRAFRAFSVTDTVSASSGGTFNGAVTFDAGANFGDNDKAIFGAGTGDFEIYSDGTYSRIMDTGGQFLVLDTNGSKISLTSDNSKEMGNFVKDGAVELHHNGSQKFSTTATGVDVTGATVTSEGGSASAPAYAITSGALGANGMFVPAANTLAFVAGFGTERMRIDSSGNVGIGTIPSVNFHAKNASGNLEIRFDSDSSRNIVFANNNGTYDAQIEAQANGTLYIATRQAQPMLFAINNSEKMRIESNGDVNIGATSGGAKLQIVGKGSSGWGQEFITDLDGSNYYFVNFLLNNGSATQVGYIYSNGSSTSYVTSSDYRLKENVVADWDATTRLKQLNPVRFNFIANPDTTVDGFLAHEVQDIVPEAITGTHNGMRDEEYEVTPAVLDEDGNEVTPAVMGTRSVPDYQGIDQSKLVPLLVKTIQELEARIAALETA